VRRKRRPELEHSALMKPSYRTATSWRSEDCLSAASSADPQEGAEIQVRLESTALCSSSGRLFRLCYNRYMKQLTKDQFDSLLQTAVIRPKIRREVRFANVAQLDEATWLHTEVLAVPDRSGNKGVLLLKATENALYVASYELKRGMTSSTGKAQPIICDFCRTWQTGTRAGSITLDKPGRANGSVTFLCCADLACSQHVRSLTSAARTSRSQLREDMTNEERIARLEQRINELAQVVELVAYTGEYANTEK